MASGVDDDKGSHSDDDLERQVTSLRSEPSTRSRPPLGRRHPSGSTPALRPGAELRRYVILERLGRGGMGEVFLAYDPGLDRRLALKVLRHESSCPHHARLDRERLRREAQALAQLSHPNVVKIYDVGTWQDRTFIAMELVEGITLSRWLRKAKRSLAEILPVFLEAGRGLAAAHAAGIVHRDFKPTNVMVGRDGRVCVLDFGLATEREHGRAHQPRPEATGAQTAPPPDPNSLTQSGLTVGTPAYMAPEQHRGDPTDARIDQFSFCVSLFEAVTGTRPFPGHDPSCLLAAKDEHHVVPIPESIQMVPWLRALIDQGLAADPADRFPSMDALLQALSRRSLPERRRQRWRRAGLVAAGLGALGIAWTLGQVPSPCERGHRQAAARWNEAQAQQVRRAFSETGLSYAETSFTRVVDQLDDYVETWQANHRVACEAAQTGQPGDMMRLDQRLQCLQRHLDQLEATVEVLREPNEDTVRRATRLVAALPMMDRCRMDGPLPAGPSPPDDPELAREVERLRGRLATGVVLNEAGRYREGLRLSQNILDDALDLGYAPLQIEAQRLVGQLLTASGQHAAAVDPLTEAALAAQALPYEQQAVPAMIDLVMLLGVEMARTEEASTWAAHARATLRRAPDRGQLGRVWGRLWARLWATEAALEMAQGHYEQSYTRATEALALGREVLGHEHPKVVTSHNNLANALWRLGKLEQAEHHYQRALQIAERAHGKDHPLVATLLQNLGGLLGAQGKYPQARLALERGLEIRRRALGEQHPEVGTMLNNLGSVLWEQGEREASLHMLQQALTIAEQALGPDDIKLVPLLHNMAELQIKTDPSQAQRHALRALDLLERLRGPDHPRKLHTLTVLGQVALQQEEIAAARDWLGQAIALVERQQEIDPTNVAGIYETLGNVEEAAHAPRVASEHFARALELRRKVGHVEASLASLCFALARTRAAANEPDERIQPLLLQAETTGTEQLRAQITSWRAKTRRPRPPASPAAISVAPAGAP